MPDASIDAVITDPPYPYVRRPYGYWTEETWRALMDPLLVQCRRVLKPRGSVLMVLQPNSQQLGSMRPWLWRFMADQCERWNVVQDAYQYNPATPPSAHCQRRIGLMRPAVKMLVWLGSPDCYRAQEEVLRPLSTGTLRRAQKVDTSTRRTAGGYDRRSGTACKRALERGGSTPYNLLSISNTVSRGKSFAVGHPAATPLDLCDHWVRYLCPPGGVVLDPFCGSGSVGVAAVLAGRSFVGLERLDTPKQPFVTIARKRLLDAEQQTEQREVSR